MNRKEPDQVTLAAMRIRQKCPDEWFTLMCYVRKQACAVRMDGELEEAVKAEYHRKSMATSILTKFNENTGE
tara:strand:+ start:4707 stop:4922 length:216 start_codon:yes stop_codon:yes gene_type:complete